MIHSPKPRIGRYWDGEGGIFAGIARGKAFDYNVILSLEDGNRDVIWTAANEWATRIELDGHCDFRLFNPPEGALLYANLKDFFEDRWYWTDTLYPADNLCAWVQTFGYGRQADARLTDACRARAIRTFPCVP